MNRPQFQLLAGCLLALLLFIAGVLAAGWPLQVRVDAPRLGMPVIEQPGAKMEVRLATSLPFALPELQLSLDGPGGVAPLELAASRWDGAVAVLTVVLPALPDGAYALRLKTPTQILELPKAVFLRSSWPATLRLVQIADLPPPGHEPLMQQFIAEMRVKKPDAVLVTGDINYEGAASNIQFIYSQLAQLDAPVIMTAGNHERTAWHRYLRVFGARDQRTNFGPLAIMSLDSAHGRDVLTPSKYRWLQYELAHLDGRTPLIQVHHPIFSPGVSAVPEAGGTGGYLRGYRRAFIELCRQYDVAIVLSGHWHQDAVYDSNGKFRNDRVDFPGTKFVVTTALGADVRQVFADSGNDHGYRWIEFTGGKLGSYSSDPRNPVPSTALGSP